MFSQYVRQGSKFASHLLIHAYDGTDYFGLPQLPHSGTADLTLSRIFSSKRAASVSAHSH